MFKAGHCDPIGWTVHLLSNMIIKSIGFRKEAEKWQDKSWFDLTCNDTAKIDMMFKSATKTELWLDLRRFIMEANDMWSCIFSVKKSVKNPSKNPPKKSQKNPSKNQLKNPSKNPPKKSTKKSIKNPSKTFKKSVYRFKEPQWA